MLSFHGYFLHTAPTGEVFLAFLLRKSSHPDIVGSVFAETGDHPGGFYFFGGEISGITGCEIRGIGYHKLGAVIFSVDRNLQFLSAYGLYFQSRDSDTVVCLGRSYGVCVAGTVFSTHFIVRERMAEGLGYAALANILAQAIGPGLGLYLVELSGYSLTFFAAAMCAAVSLLIVTLLPYMQEKRPHFSFHKISFTDLIALEYADFMLIAALLSISSSWVTTYLSLIAIERNIVNVGLFFTFYSAFMAFVRPMFGTLHDQRGIYTVMLPAIFCESLAIFMIGNATSLLLILASSLFKAVGQGAGSPALQAEVIKRMDKNKSGVAASTVLIGMHIGNAFGPMLGGVFVKDLGFTKMFSGFAVLSLILNFILLSLRYRKDKATS